MYSNGPPLQNISNNLYHKTRKSWIVKPPLDWNILPNPPPYSFLLRSFVPPLLFPHPLTALFLLVTLEHVLTLCV